MEVADGQQLGLPLGEPLARRRALTLWTMPVATTVVSDDRVTTAGVLTARDMAAERRGPAALDRRHDLELAEAHVPGVGRSPSGAVVAEDVRNLQSGTRGRRYFAGGASLSRCFGFLRSLSRSRGLSTAEIRPV